MDLLNKYSEWRKTKNGSIFGLLFGIALGYLSFSWAIESGSILYYIFGFFFLFDASASGINLIKMNKEGKVNTEVKKPAETKATAKKSTSKSAPKKKTATKRTTPKKTSAKKTNATKRKPRKTT